MTHVTKAITALVLFTLIGCATGCVKKKPLNFRFVGVSCEQPVQDRRDCSCRNAKQIGIDAKTRAAIIRCE